jgi:hypothetical protein
MKKIIFTYLLTTGLVVVCQGQLAGEIFEKYFKATGGISLWNNVKSYSINQNFVSNAASDYQMEIKVSIPEMEMLKTKTIMKRNFIYGINSSDAFFKIPLGGTVYQVKKLSNKEKMKMQREVGDLLAPFYQFEARGYLASYVGMESMGAQTVHHIELANSDTKYHLYFNNSTDLLAKQKLSLPTGEEITEEFTAYSTSAFGIKFPSTGTYYSNIDKRNVKFSAKIVYNPLFEKGTFWR